MSTQAETWQPATRRSIERWLTELEQAGWLVWARRGETPAGSGYDNY